VYLVNILIFELKVLSLLKLLCLLFNCLDCRQGKTSPFKLPELNEI